MTTLNDTIETVGSAVHSAKKGTERAASSAFSDIASGIHAASSAINLIRGLGVDDALGWIGLSRRRGFFGTAAIFGSGILVGAGVGMLLAPMAGSDLRKAFLKRLQGIEKDAEKVADQVKDAVVNAEHKVEDVAGKAKDAVMGVAKDAVVGAAKVAVVGAAKDAVNGAEEKVNDAKDKIVGAAKDAAQGAEQKVDDLANKAKDLVDGDDRKADTKGDKAKDPNAYKDANASTKDANASNKDANDPKDPNASAERRNTGGPTSGNQRPIARS